MLLQVCKQFIVVSSYDKDKIYSQIVDLQAPATPEKVLMALEQLPSERF